MDTDIRRFFTRRNLAVIGVFMVAVLGLYALGGVGATNAPTQEQAAQFCEDRCSDIEESGGQVQQSEMYNYCKNTFEIDSGSPLTGPELKEGESEYCSDNARCANLNTCQVDETTLDMQGCIEFMTQYHQDQLDESPEEARQHTEDLLSEENEETGVGSCEEKPSWYTEEIE